MIADSAEFRAKLFDLARELEKEYDRARADRARARSRAAIDRALIAMDELREPIASVKRASRPMPPLTAPSSRAAWNRARVRAAEILAARKGASS